MPQGFVLPLDLFVQCYNFKYICVYTELQSVPFHDHVGFHCTNHHNVLMHFPLDQHLEFQLHIVVIMLQWTLLCVWGYDWGGIARWECVPFISFTWWCPLVIPCTNSPCYLLCAESSCYSRPWLTLGIVTFIFYQFGGCEMVC